jgi:phosphocarrier protein HPr
MADDKRTVAVAGLTKDFVIANKLGLHARASATLVKVATQYKSEILLTKGDQSVNAKSILGLMTLAAAKGTNIRITCTGADEAAAMTAVGACIEGRFGEE